MNEAKAWGTSFIANRLPVHVVDNCLMRPIRSIYDVVRWVWRARVPPPSFLYVAIQQSGMSYLPSRLKCEFSGVVCMQIASFTTDSIVQLSCCSVLVSPQRMGWSSVQACSVIADLSVKPLMHPSLCSFRRVVAPMYTFPQVHGTS